MTQLLKNCQRKLKMVQNMQRLIVKSIESTDDKK